MAVRSSHVLGQRFRGGYAACWWRSGRSRSTACGVRAVRPADAHLGLEEESSGWRTLGPPVRARAWPAPSQLLVVQGDLLTTPLLRFERVARTGRRIPGVILSPDILPEYLPNEA